VIYTSKIREIHYGDLENTLFADYKIKREENSLDARDYVCPGEGGESYNTFHERVKDFLNSTLIPILKSLENNETK
jgi:broad specificity phosphatase PhoE